MEAAAPEPVQEPPIEAVGETEEPVAVTEPTSEPVALAAPPADDATTGALEPAASDGLRVDTAGRAKRERPVKRTKPAVQPPVVAAPAPVVPTETTEAVTVRVVAGANENTFAQATSGDRFHTVHRGESLWSIASDLLGDGAGAAQVAREVNRLWELNENRIATGSPDLLYAGTRLRLR